jgi:tetratricopeptide (TPR) repeat protein
MPEGPGATAMNRRTIMYVVPKVLISLYPHRVLPVVFLSLISSALLLLTACSADDSNDLVTAEVSEATPTATAAVEPTLEPTATTAPSPTPEPEPVEEAEEESSESVTFYLNAFNTMGRGEYVDAERIFTTVIELEPEFARGWDGRGQALLLQGKYEEAMFDFDRAIELKPNLHEAYANRALTRMALNDVEGAERDAKRAYELEPDSVAAHIVLGRVYANEGESEKAQDWFNTAINADPEDASTWWWRGRFYRDVLGAGNAALNDFNMAIELSPAQAALYLDRAQLYVGAEVRYDSAREDLEEAISLSQDPKLPHIIEAAEELLAIIDEREAAAVAP